MEYAIYWMHGEDKHSGHELQKQLPNWRKTLVGLDPLKLQQQQQFIDYLNEADM